MPSKILKLVNSYQSPDLLLKYPRLIRIQHSISWLLNLRFWHVWRFSKEQLGGKEEDFVFVDAGCGSGELLFAFVRKYPKSRYYGIDINENALEAGEKFRQFNNYNNIDFEKAGVEHFRLKEKADLIICISVVQLLKDPSAGIKNMGKNLKYGGKLLIYIPVNYKRVIPGYKSFRESWTKSKLSEWDNVENHLTEKSVTDIAKNENLKLEECRYGFGMPGKIAYELLSFGQIMIMRLPWILAILFAIIYFPVLAIPSWILMGIDLITRHRTGNGLMMLVSKQ